MLNQKLTDNIPKVVSTLTDKVGTFFQNLSMGLSALIIAFFYSWEVGLDVCMASSLNLRLG